MKILSRFINYSLQKDLVELVASENIPYRVRANGALETAEKWKDAIFDFCSDIAFDLFEDPIIFNYGEPIQYDEYIMKLAKHNIPFFTFIINNDYTIIISDSDTDYILNHIGFNDIRFVKE